jgi:hypothetical protein
MKKKILVVAGLLAMSGALTAQSVYPGQHAGKLKRETVAPMKVKSFDLKDVRLLPSRFRENMMRDSMWMASIEVNRLLHSFRTNAGVFAGREGGYMTVRYFKDSSLRGCRRRDSKKTSELRLRKPALKYVFPSVESRYCFSSFPLTRFSVTR